jgi:hypothetical protein
VATYLTVNEAARKTGKSPSSIRRVIYPILHDPNHPDRSHIQPGADDARELRVRGEPFAWRISEEFLTRAIPPSSPVEQGREPKGTGHDADLLSMLQRELEIKNQQITQHAELISRQMELLNGLSERLREGNILMGTLQQRLALAEKNLTPPVADAMHVTDATPSAPSPSPKPAASPKVPTDKKAKKRGFLSRLFR